MGWLITIAVFAALAVLPLGVSVAYDAAGLLVRVIAGPVRVTLIPAKKRAKKEKKTREKKPKKASAPAKVASTEAQKGGSLKEFIPLVQIALDMMDAFRRKLRVNRLEAKIVLAGDDPADLAINYGRAWTALGNLWPRLESFLVIQKRSVEVQCDFTADETLITARLDVTITLGRMLAVSVVYGIRAIKEFLRIRKQNKGGATI